MHSHNHSRADAPSISLSRFVVQSSDVIQDMRINVSEENSDKVIWYKERFLGDDEIIEHVVYNPTSTICWSIHRPKRGWYIRIRSPSFPPDVFISLMPVPQDSLNHAEAALSFSSRTNIPIPSQSGDTDFTHTDSASTSTTHSYPPTPPPALVVQPPSPTSVHAKLDQVPRKPLRKPHGPPPTQITDFVLAPLSSQQVSVPMEGGSIFTRALSALRSHRPSHSNSFTLSRLPPVTPLSPPPPYAPNTPVTIPSQSLTSTTPPPPLLVFHDRTPVLTVRSITGMLEINQTEERLLGVESSFWVAIALTYLEFLEERESYLAALND